MLATLVLAAVEGLCAERNEVSPLSRQVTRFSIGYTSVLDALLWLGQDERLCFGIEFSGPELTRGIQFTAEETTVGEAVMKILGSHDAYQLSVSEGVVLIRKKGVRPPSWLGHRLPEFDLPRMELMTADSGLWMRVEMHLSPSIKGFAGDAPVTDPVDEVGPFHGREQTVRRLLCKLAASSRGASWFPTTEGVRFSFPASINRLWTFVAYSAPNAIRPK